MNVDLLWQSPWETSLPTGSSIDYWARRPVWGCPTTTVPVRHAAPRPVRLFPSSIPAGRRLWTWTALPRTRDAARRLHERTRTKDEAPKDEAHRTHKKTAQNWSQYIWKGVWRSGHVNWQDARRQRTLRHSAILKLYPCDIDKRQTGKCGFRLTAKATNASACCCRCLCCCFSFMHKPCGNEVIQILHCDTPASRHRVSSATFRSQRIKTTYLYCSRAPDTRYLYRCRLDLKVHSRVG